jgi:hypothetical protein
MFKYNYYPDTTVKVGNSIKVWENVSDPSDIGREIMLWNASNPTKKITCFVIDTSNPKKIKCIGKNILKSSDIISNKGTDTYFLDLSKPMYQPPPPPPKKQEPLKKVK